MRQRALDPSTSFIVQAPAGSGKTELLTQRFLKLLSRVEAAPEEIVAITFTRKAAAEMRHRLIESLEIAKSPTPPAAAHKQQTWSLAKLVLERDSSLQWDLLNNPNRLRILTIDALAATLSGQLPILAHFGAKPTITEQANTLYQTAAERLLYTLADNPPYQSAIQTLLLQVNNQAQTLISLLARLLAKREQWLPHILLNRANPTRARESLETALKRSVEDCIAAVKQQLDPITIETLTNICSEAAKILSDNGTKHPLLAFITRTDTLLSDSDDQDRWVGLANLLLTQKGEWRKSVDKRQGFSPKSPHKTSLLSLLTELQDNGPLQHALKMLLLSPPVRYSDAQWSIIDALIEILPLLTAQLHLLFQEKGVVDFIELNLAALRALGESDAPTDLALYLDHQIRHLLVDEFQDTSITQFTLLERLTAGWEPGDGRSIFLVGDPMQSIYRFRDAEVGLFLHAEHNGINDIPLEKITLRKNFRSQARIVDWINNSFSYIFPKSADITLGAIPYSLSEPTQAASDHMVNFIVDHTNNSEHEADQVLAHMQMLLEQEQETSIAILVRARRQLIDIIQKLQTAEIPFQAVDLDKLSTSRLIQDLIAFTKALRHQGDRMAWLSVLRAPYIGLLLSDLLIITETAGDNTIWSALENFDRIPNLSEDALKRCERVVPIFKATIKHAGRQSLEHWIEGAWLALGGPTATTEESLPYAQQFFDCLSKLAQTNPNFDADALEETIDTLFASNTAKTNTRVQIMTIHKSKGLEFDHVILPGLHLKSGIDEQAMLLWLERANTHGSSDLILAPIKSSDQESDPVYRYLNAVEKEKLSLETARLFYVAVTRAKQSLALFSQPKPAQGSFLSMIATQYTEALLPPESDDAPSIHTLEKSEHTIPPLTRLTRDWMPPEHIRQQNISENQTDNPFDLTLEDDLPREIGTTIHFLLSQPKSIQSESTATLLNKGLQYLQSQRYCSPEEMNQASHQIQLALENVKTDPRAQWILDTTHQNQYCEIPISTRINNTVKHLIIDRTFETEDACWIIDYKTASPQNIDLTLFLSEQLLVYQPQLQAYSTAMKALTNKPIRSALYFPLCKGWVEMTSEFVLQ